MAYSIDLSGRVAFVTGASSGLGAQFARTLARAGAAVVLASRRIDKLKDLRAEIEGEGGDAHVIELDVTDHDSIKSAVAHAETEVGSIDILVNNAGVGTTQRIQDVTPEDFDYMFATNVKGAFFVAQEVGKRMLARARGAAPGTYTGGRIINVSSVAGHKVGPGGAVYSATKTAVRVLSEGLRQEVLHQNIRVTVVEPGWVETELLDHNNEFILKMAEERKAKMGTLLASEDIGNVGSHDTDELPVGSDELAQGPQRWRGHDDIAHPVGKKNTETHGRGWEWGFGSGEFEMVRRGQPLPESVLSTEYTARIAMYRRAITLASDAIVELQMLTRSPHRSLAQLTALWIAGGAFGK